MTRTKLNGLLCSPLCLATCLALAGPSVGYAADQTGNDLLEEGAKPNVINGEPVTSGDYRGVAMVVFEESLCTGSLIAPNIVLTADHCVMDDTPLGVLLDTATPDADEAAGRIFEQIEVVDVIRHPLGFPMVDAALLVLAENSTVTPIPIAHGCAAKEITNGGAAVIAGFGVTSLDDPLEFPTMNRTEATIGDADCSLGEFSDLCSESEMTTLSPASSGCFGDSGGPVFLDTSFGEVLAGVVSWGDEYCSFEAPSFHARVEPLVGWIQESTGIVLAEPTCNNAAPSMTAAASSYSVAPGEDLLIDFAIADNGETELVVAVAPGQGTAVIEGNRLRYSAENRIEGEDTVIVKAIDDGFPSLSSEPFVVTFVASTPSAEESEGGCSVTSSSQGACFFFLTLVALIGLGRRRNGRC